MLLRHQRNPDRKTASRRERLSSAQAETIDPLSLSRTIDPSQPSTLIFSDDGFCCRRRAGRRRRDGEGDPGIPATGTILCGKLSVSLEIEIALHVADRKKEPDLGTDANHLGLEAADTVA